MPLDVVLADVVLAGLFAAIGAACAWWAWREGTPYFRRPACLRGQFLRCLRAKRARRRAR